MFITWPSVINFHVDTHGFIVSKFQLIFNFVNDSVIRINETNDNVSYFVDDNVSYLYNENFRTISRTVFFIVNSNMFCI